MSDFEGGCPERHKCFMLTLLVELLTINNIMIVIIMCSEDVF